MHDIDLRQIDLNLLVVLDVLLQERHVTRAAARLHRTQSATSHALNRLRTQLDDPILVRVGGEMRPTPRAERIAPEVRRLLHSIARVLSHDDVWTPATSDRVFTIVGPDFMTAALPRLLAGMSAVAPRSNVELLAPAREMLRDIAEGRFDLAFGPADLPGAEGVIAETIATLPWAVFARRGHPAIERWGVDAWTAHPHIRIRTDSRRLGPVDVAVRMAGVERHRGPVLPHFLLAPPLLTRSDLLLSVPYGVLADIADRFDLVALPMPVPIKPLKMALFRSARLAHDAALDWFVGQVRPALSETFDRPLPAAAR